jgi:hypothetical protein
VEHRRGAGGEGNRVERWQVFYMYTIIKCIKKYRDVDSENKRASAHTDIKREKKFKLKNKLKKEGNYNFKQVGEIKTLYSITETETYTHAHSRNLHIG